MKRLDITYILSILLTGFLFSTNCNTDKKLNDPCERIFAEWSKCVSTGTVQKKEKLTKASFIDACKKSIEDKNKLPSDCTEKPNCAMLELCIKGILTVDLFRGAADALAPPREDPVPKTKQSPVNNSVR